MQILHDTHFLHNFQMYSRLTLKGCPILAKLLMLIQLDKIYCYRIKPYSDTCHNLHRKVHLIFDGSYHTVRIYELIECTLRLATEMF